MKKDRRLNKALKEFEIWNMTADGNSTQYEVKKEIKAIADNDAEFANELYEIGCGAVATEYRKKHNWKRDVVLDTIGCLGLFVTFLGIVIIPRGFQTLGLVMILLGACMSTVFTIKGVTNVK